LGITISVVVALVVGTLALAPPAQATATGLEVSVVGSVVTVKAHPGGGPGDIVISRTSGVVTVAVDPESGGVAQIWSVDPDCSPSTGDDVMSVSCPVPPATTATPRVEVDMRQSTIDGSERLFVVSRISATFYGSPLDDSFEMLDGYPATMSGEGGDDYLAGHDDVDVINGGPGQDYIVGGGGRDQIASGPGTDEVDAEDGQVDTIDCGDIVGSADDPDTVYFDARMDDFRNCVNYTSVKRPASVTPPTITGQPQVGAPAVATTGEWSGGGSMAFEYRWMSCPNLKPSPNVPTDCSVAVNWSASAVTFTPRTSDVGRRLVVFVRATNELGKAEARSSLSNPVNPAGPPVNTVKPSFPAPPVVGVAMTGDRGQWTGANITYLHSWMVCPTASSAIAQCSRAAGPQSQETFTPGAADRGKFLRYIVTASNSAGATVASSEPQLVERHTVPGAPTNFDWTQRSTTEIELSWDPPIDQGGRPVTEYRLEYWRFDNWNYNSLKEFRFVVATSERSYPFTLEPRTGTGSIGSQYWFRVAAVNSIGTGEWSNLFPVSTLPPPPPDEIFPKRIGGTRANLRWSQASYSNPSKEAFIESAGRFGILRWEMEYRTRPIVVWPVVDVEAWGDWQSLGYATSTDQDISNLSLSTTYQFRIRAENQTGWGEWTLSRELDIDGRVEPGQVQNAAVYTVGDREFSSSRFPQHGGRLSVTWKRPLDDGYGGDGNLFYNVTATPGGRGCSFDPLHKTSYGCLITGLKDGVPYDITITTGHKETSAKGVQSVTNVGRFVPYGMPGDVVVTKADVNGRGKSAEVVLEWTWPKDLGGFLPDHPGVELELTASLGGGKRAVIGTFSPSQTRATYEKLTPGKTNYFWFRIITPRAKGESVLVDFDVPK